MFHLQELIALAALAQGQPGPGGSLLGSPIFLIVIIVLMFYLILYKPEKKRRVERENMLKSLERGSEVMTAGGIMGKITALTDQIVTLEIAPNTRIRVGRQFINSVVAADKSGGEDKEPEQDKKKKKGGK